MIVAIIILTVITVAALVFALFCYTHYYLIRKDFEAYQRITKDRLRIDDNRYDYLCNLADKILKIKQNNESKEKRCLAKAEELKSKDEKQLTKEIAQTSELIFDFKNPAKSLGGREAFWTSERIEELRAFFVNGGSVGDAAAHFGVSKASVYMTRSRYNMTSTRSRVVVKNPKKQLRRSEGGGALEGYML